VNIQFTREKHTPSSAEKEDIKKLLKCMLDISWAGKHGDHSIVCEMCNMTSIWFKLGHMLLENVFPDGGASGGDDTLGSVPPGGLFRSSSSSKGVSNRSLCKFVRARSFNPQSPNSDQNEISLYILTTCSNIQVVRIKEEVTSDETY